MTSSRGQGLAVSMDFKLFLEVVVGIHSGKVGVHVGKDAHWECWLCAMDSWGALKTNMGGTCGRQISWAAPDSWQMERCTTMCIKIKLPLGPPS